MHVDDRLATVLEARANGDVARRIQYRQLVDLIGTSAAGARGEQIDAALVRLTELAQQIPAVDRARALGEPGVRLRNPRLVAELASGEPAVALAAIRAARLSEHDWIDLIPALPLAARGLLRVRRDLGPAVEAHLDRLGITGRALPAGEAARATPAAPDPGEPAAATPRRLSPEAEPIQGIAAIVRRIEAFRRNRDAGGGAPVAANDSPRLPLGELESPSNRIGAFSFATDTAGRIGWAEPPIGGMAVGLLLPMDTRGAAHDLAENFRRRQPIRAHRIALEGAPAIAGEWQVDATPDFDSAGHFTGYVGRFRRPAPPLAPAHNAEADRVRQVLHELRTPVNAIQGFAEVIQQQLFGATPHEYRALAAGIAADAARMLAGFEELDRYARLDSGALDLEPGSTDLAMALAGIIQQLEAFTAARGSGFELEIAADNAQVALAAEDAERLAWRLLATLAGSARPGEVLALALAATEGNDGIRLTARLPEGLAGLDDLFEATPPQAGQALSAGMFGNGFTLRLAAAEARAAGGALLRDGDSITLTLPRAAASNANVCLRSFGSTAASEAR